LKSLNTDERDLGGVAIDAMEKDHGSKDFTTIQGFRPCFWGEFDKEMGACGGLAWAWKKAEYRDIFEELGYVVNSCKPL
jgi:hypothetical protein